MQQNPANGLETAARWNARLGAPDCTAREREAFAEWLVASPENERAYRKVERFLSLTALLPDEQLTGASAAAPVLCEPPRASRWTLPLAACAAGLALLAWMAGGQRVDLPAPELMSNLTRSSERLTLADGSVVFLDAGSRLAVTMTDERRRIDLLHGRALFEVAHDSSRPFAVRAAGAETVATGTVFQVENQDGEVQVTLASGSVTVSATGSQPTWQQPLTPGLQLSWTSTSTRPVTRTVDTTQATAWTSGRLNFTDTPLQEVVEELNRYDDRKIILGDADLAGLKVGGSYIAGDNRVVVQALQFALPLRATDRGEEEIVLLPR